MAMADINPETMGIVTIRILIEGVHDRSWKGDRYTGFYVRKLMYDRFPGLLIP
jgi:hypothetical protein